MDSWYGASSFIALLLSSYLITRMFKPDTTAEAALSYFVSLASQILLIGYLLSAADRLGSLAGWAGLSVLVLSVAFTVAMSDRTFREACLARIPLPNISLLRDRHLETPLLEKASVTNKALVALLLSTVIVLGTANLIIVLFTAPHSWDTMTTHCTRVAYYLQHGNFHFYPCSYWCQVFYPVNSAALVLYTYLVSGRNENLMQLVQFISYWMAACAVYGISRRIGYTRRASLFSSCVFALLTECLMEATTVQNDMVIAAFIGVAVYFLLAFKETRKRRYLVLAGMGIAIALGTKQSAFLMLPSLAVVSVYALSFTSRATLRQRMADPVVFLVCLAIAVGIFALGAGYLEDYRNFGNFLFPDRIKENIFAGYSIRSILIGGTLNLFRHWFEFLSFDGLPPLSIVRKCQALMRGLPEKALRSLGIDLESPPGVLVPFLFGKMPWADDNVSYWGIFGFALVWVIVLLHAAGITRSWANWVLSIAAIVFVFSISYIVHYTPWDGRYFIVAAVLAVPTLGWCVDSRHSTPFRLYVAFVVLVGCISAYTAIFFSSPKSLFASKFLRNASVFKFDRLGQCTLTNRPYYEPLKKFEELVPKEAVVAVCLPENSFEYPLFGERCTRRIVPAYSHLKGFLPIPKDADYLLYSREILDPRESDIYLGAEWYLRRLIKES